MDNLLVTAKMTTPTSFIDPIHLDAILLYEYCRRNDKDFYNRNLNVDDFEYPIDFPVRRIEFGDGDWFYACSDAIYTIDKVTKCYWNRRTDDRNFDKVCGVKTKINTGSGSFRNYRMPIILNHCKEFKWYLVGDKEEIEYLLLPLSSISKQPISHIGKKSQAQCKGEVREWVVEKCYKDYSIFKEDMLIKTVPIEYVGENNITKYSYDKYTIKQCNYRPPYWLMPPHPKVSRKMCIVPIEKEVETDRDLNLVADVDFDEELLNNKNKAYKKRHTK